MVTAMELLTADNAQQRFREMLLKVQREPVQINSNGRTVAVVMSAESCVTADSDIAKELGACVDRVKADPDGQLSDADTFMHELKSGKYD